jgi:hypothetical protein
MGHPSEATGEVRAAALAGVREAQSAVKRNTTRGPVIEQLDHEITLFLQNPDGWPTQARFWLEWGCSHVTDLGPRTN